MNVTTTEGRDTEMLSHLRHLWTAPQEHHDDPVRQEWERLLAAADSSQERDEINDVFSRALAA